MLSINDGFQVKQRNFLAYHHHSRPFNDSLGNGDLKRFHFVILIVSKLQQDKKIQGGIQYEYRNDGAF